MSIKVLYNYGGRPSNMRRIEPGVYAKDDPALFGLADYLVENGHAVLSIEPVEVIEYNVVETEEPEGSTELDFEPTEVEKSEEPEVKDLPAPALPKRKRGRRRNVTIEDEG
jgi:hypothetical protein